MHQKYSMVCTILNVYEKKRDVLCVLLSFAMIYPLNNLRIIKG
jgi:hypothetical protein